MSKESDFRKELIKIMPGYKWTIHRPLFGDRCFLDATGIQTSGMNRLSTLYVNRSEKNGEVKYSAQSSNYGRRADPIASPFEDRTLARVLRRMQDHYEAMRAMYATAESRMEKGRKNPGQP